MKSNIEETQIITLSGVHGVGKSTIINILHSLLSFNEGEKRPKNYFQTPYEAMLFFIAAFSDRDKKVNQSGNGIYILDRYSYIDIKIYIKALKEIDYISENECKSLLIALDNGYSIKIRPTLSFLLHDKPENILNRIKKFREPSKHHLFERDIKFIRTLENLFLSEFQYMKQNFLNQFYITSINNQEPSKIGYSILAIIEGKLNK